MMGTETNTEVVPWSGEQVTLSETSTAVRCLREANSFWYELRSFQERCRETLRAESDKRGQRTFEIDGRKVEVATEEASQDVTYDVQYLWDGLEGAGLPLERLGETITYEPRVNGTIIRQLKKNPTYAAIIERAITSTTPKTRSVRVK
jgi:hypothetical protein